MRAVRSLRPRTQTLSSWWNVVAPWLAPALLFSIALAHFAYARFSSLSPWKGGGFGMFSTVDSPGARFLRIELVASEGRIPVFIPDDLREAARELRTTGSEPLTAELAQALAQGTWVRVRLTSAVQHYRHLLGKSVPPDLDQQLTAGLGHAAAADDAAIEFRKLNFVRKLKPNESPSANDAVLDVQSVRVEIWKYVFEREPPSLKARKFMEVSSGGSSRPKVGP